MATGILEGTNLAPHRDFFLLNYSSEIRKIIGNVSEVSVGPVIVKKQIAEQETRLREMTEKRVSPEKVYAVVKAFKEFEEAIRHKRISEIGKFFSQNYQEREKTIEKWSAWAGKDIHFEVKDASLSDNKIKVSINQKYDGKEEETEVTLIFENDMWRFLQ